MEGPFAEDARRLIDIDRLTAFSCAQNMELNEELEMWLRFNDLLGLKVEGDSTITRLFRLQEHIAKYCEHMACPSKHGIHIASSRNHFPGCSLAVLHARMEVRQNRLEEERVMRSIRNEKQRMAAQSVVKNSSPRVLSRLGSEEIHSIIRNCCDVLSNGH